MKAIVVGAGIAGLAAAFDLRKAGWDVRVVEAEGRVGGRIRVIKKQGYHLEPIASSILTGYSDYLSLATDAGIYHELQPASTSTLLMRKGRLFDLDSNNAIRTLFTGALPFSSKARIPRLVKDFLRINPDLTDLSGSYAYDTETALEYCKRRLDEELFHVFVDPLLRTYTLQGGAHVSALTLFAALATVGGRNRVLSYRSGIDRLPLVLAEKLDVQLNSPVSGVVRTERNVTVEMKRNGAAPQVEIVDAVVIATRVPEAVAVFPEFASKAQPFVDSLTYNKVLTVHLGYNRRTHSTAGSVLVPSREHADVGVMLLDHNKRDNYAPPGGSQFKCCFDPATLDRYVDDEKAIAVAAEFVERLFPELRGSRDMSHVTRFDLGVPDPKPGMYTLLHKARSALDPDDRVQFAGDYLSTIGMNSAVHYGRKAAANLLRRFGGNGLS